MKGQKKTYFNYFIDVLMVAAILVVSVTGVIKIPWLIDFFSIDLTKIPFEEISLVHDIGGLVITFLILLHIILHFKWFIVITKNIWKKRKSPLKWGVILGLLIISGVSIYSFLIIFDTTKSVSESEGNILISTEQNQTYPSSSEKGNGYSFENQNDFEGSDYIKNTIQNSQIREHNKGDSIYQEEETTTSSISIININNLETKKEIESSSETKNDISITNLPDDIAQDEYMDGIYTGKSRGYKSYITVEVLVEDGFINKINILSHKESRGYYENVFNELPGQIINKQSPDVDIVTRATYTSLGFLKAVEEALEKSKSVD